MCRFETIVHSFVSDYRNTINMGCLEGWRMYTVCGILLRVAPSLLKTLSCSPTRSFLDIHNTAPSALPFTLYLGHDAEVTAACSNAKLNKPRN